MSKRPVDIHLNVCDQEYREILSEQEGMTFKFILKQGRFIHTFCAGQLLYKIGLSPEMIIGKELKDFLPLDIAEYKESFYNEAWQGKEGISYEGEKEGVVYLASLRPIKQSGTVIEIVASCVDITERKKAEEELRVTKELLESLFRNSVDGICVTTLDGNVVQVNNSFVKIFGWTQEELCGKSVSSVPLNMKSDILEISKQLQSGMKVISFEAVTQRKDGDTIYIHLTMSPIEDTQGNVIALMGITRDISERKRSEDFLRKADKLNVVGQLAAGFAHEIRNPLTTLRGFLQIMQSKENWNSEYANIMVAEIDRIDSIISEFLTIAKPQSMSYKKNDVRSILQNVIKLLEAQATLHNIQFRVHVESYLPLVKCSEIEIKQVFVNLIKNAIEAMPSGGVISVVIVVQTNYIYIRFIDQGVGIPETLVQRLGEPFFTTKEKGTGLGLMMCYKIISDHKGKLTVNSIVGEGTTFEIQLPLEKEN
ncbi:PAS domain S-box protein [Paenibacillus illinoisensis]|uniref:histidine kinase n=1 Tax=Paenibacillus illinoisensis TaxID=59845 RepID=A0A2W0CHY6_9BACL|nr:PAS domain S-box protein [Paenibacillus illinoisensis]PYY29662.1 Sporulation kinase E [Paenibacillus illinoisensis]